MYDNIAIQIHGWNNLFFVDALTDITAHSLYNIVPLVTLKGYEYRVDNYNNSTKSYRTITINRWLILSITVPGNVDGTSAPLNEDTALPQVLALTM